MKHVAGTVVLMRRFWNFLEYQHLIQELNTEVAEPKHGATRGLFVPSLYLASWRRWGRLDGLHFSLESFMGPYFTSLTYVSCRLVRLAEKQMPSLMVTHRWASDQKHHKQHNVFMSQTLTCPQKGHSWVSATTKSNHGTNSLFGETPFSEAKREA